MMNVNDEEAVMRPFIRGRDKVENDSRGMPCTDVQELKSALFSVNSLLVSQIVLSILGAYYSHFPSVQV